MIQFWASSKLGRLDFSIRKHVKFYAPLVESLDFLGIDPVGFGSTGPTTRIGRDGLTHATAQNVPPFDFSGETPLGLYLSISLSSGLSYGAANNLHGPNTLIWFEDSVPKSTPTDSNPFNSSGAWIGNKDIHIKHIARLDYQAAAATIVTIQEALLDAPQVITPPAGWVPPSYDPGTFVDEEPTGSGVNWVLSQNCNPNSIVITAFGLLLMPVASNPALNEYIIGGTGNRNLTLNADPTASPSPFRAWYVTA